MQRKPLSLDLNVAEVLDRWPGVVRLFIQYHLDCVGCPMAQFCDLEMAVTVYDLDAQCFVQALQAVIASEDAQDTPPYPLQESTHTGDDLQAGMLQQRFFKPQSFKSFKEIDV